MTNFSFGFSFSPTARIAAERRRVLSSSVGRILCYNLNFGLFSQKYHFLNGFSQQLKICFWARARKSVKVFCDQNLHRGESFHNIDKICCLFGVARKYEDMNFLNSIAHVAF